MKFEEDGTAHNFDINVAPQNVVYHVKDKIRLHLGLGIQDQSLRMGCFNLHNGRRLSFYAKLIHPDDPSSVSVTVVNTGPKLNSIEFRKTFQIFVRTLTG